MATRRSASATAFHGKLPAAPRLTLLLIAAALTAFPSRGVAADAGVVFGWGDDSLCQASAPPDVTGITAISAGSAFSMALKWDGSVLFWGFNPAPPGQPCVPAGLGIVRAIAAGQVHALALKEDTTVVAWGYNGHMQTSVPSGLVGVKAIAAGHNHSLALKEDGTVVAWGSNLSGQTAVPSGLGGVIAIAAGGVHSVALRSDGTVVAWGKFSTVPAGLSGVVGIAAGQQHSLALKSDGTVVAWGVNNFGEGAVPAGLSGVVAITVGDFYNLALKGNGTVVGWGYNPDGRATVPQGLIGVRAIAAGMGGSHNLALKYDGTVVGWGQNANGQAVVPSSHPSGQVTAVATSGSHSLAIQTDGTVIAWGLNNAGQATVPPGLGSVTAVAATWEYSLALKSDGTIATWGRVPCSQPVPAGLSGVTAIAAAGQHSLALKSDGTVAAWGCEPEGWVPEWGFSVLDVPEDLSDVTAIAAGVLHNLALRSDGTVVAWGSGDAANTPVGLSEVTALAAGGVHSVALQSDGTVFVWGGDAQIASVPSNLDGVIAIAAGFVHTLALKADGTVVAWGYDSYGEGTVPSDLSRVTAIASANDGYTNLAIVRPPGLTPVGFDVIVAPMDTTTGEPDSQVELTFETVTNSGETTVEFLPSGSEPPPPGYVLQSDGAGDPISFELVTTASYQGLVDVCTSYSDSIIADEASLRILHYWDPTMCVGRPWGIDISFDYQTPGWENVTRPGFPDTVANRVCGSVTCLSPFVIAKPLAIAGPAAPVPVMTAITLYAPHSSASAADWDFGDGSNGAGTLTSDQASWAGAHAYTAPGIYTVALKLFGTSGAEIGSAEFHYVVVYDPSAGFVTGGGWFDSPAGAVPGDSALVGKATFGFVSRYQKSTTRPTGSTEFQFQAGGFNFHSQSYDWLVVAGAKAQFKGSGTVNGEGSYGFLLTAIDADVNTSDAFTVDRFRIKIWREVDATVVYDNALGNNADAATTPIAGGAIIIQAPKK